MALIAAALGAYSVAAVFQGEDFATVASSGIAALVLGGVWYFVGWLMNR